MKKQKKLSIHGFGKRCLSAVVSLALTVSILPAFPARAEEPALLKAGAINTSEDHVTRNQPFSSGTAGSTYFRIPAFIVTKNGNLLAAADARYSTGGDGGGLDTIASVSMDGGKTWKYSFPLYFPDSNGYAGNTATTIIDPVLVQDAAGTIYCMADVNPTGVTTMGGYIQPGVGTGYITVDGQERLALTSDYSNVNTLPTDDNKTVYEYYVGDWNEAGYAPVISREDGAASTYAVDKWYNLYTVRNDEYVADLTQKQVNSDTDIQQNVFYKDSVLHVYNTGYIMYAKSTDDGLTWSDPEILNPQIKRENGTEKALLVSPGNGTLTSNNTIVIPFYDHGDGEENASIIWSEDNGATWKRSGDVPGASAGGWWSSESEVVELEDGTLRMFFRSGQGTVCYADATKGSNGEYSFSAPVSTGVSCTSTCNVTALSYSKKIDGKQAILVGAPGGGGRSNGKIFCFLVDEEDKSLTLKHTYSVPNSSSTYAYSCMAELNDGTIGLLWENAGAAIRYDQFNILELVPNGYIEGAEIDLQLYANETYSREYTVENQYMTGITVQPNAAVATAELVRGTSHEETIIPMYAHIANQESSLESFSTSADPGLKIADAEFTITSTGTDKIYTIYNESKRVYLTHLNYADNYFSSTAGNMKIENVGGGSTVRICKENGERYIIFFFKEMNFNGNGGGYTEDARWSGEMTLLEKKDTAGADDLIPGYQAVSQVTSGKKYLITYLYNNRVIVLYPTNGKTNQTKLVGTADTKTTYEPSTVTITGKGEGTTKAVIDGMTYNITCLGNRKLHLAAGQNYFIAGAENFTSADTSVATVEKGKETRKALFDCLQESNNNLNGYSQTPNWDINMSGAEFTIESSGDLYTIYSPTEEVYLVNSNAASYFAGTAVTQSLTPVENSDGTTSFEIRRVSNDDKNNRYVYFFYEKMGFDAVSAKSGFEARGDFGFEFLEKQETTTNLDPIPGYRRVSSITPGKSYLITEYYDDGIIVLYPRNGIVNQSKLYQAVEVEGVFVTAKIPGRSTTVTIDGVLYEITIEQCRHDGEKSTQNMREAGCEEKGYTGDTYCSICNEKIADGQEIPSLGHSWNEGVITKEVTLEEDGEKTYTCQWDAAHTRTEAISSLDYAKTTLQTRITEAQAEAAKTEVYTEASLTALGTAIKDANDVAGKTDAAKQEILSALSSLETAVRALTTKAVQEKIDELTELLSGKEENLDLYTEASRNALTAAYKKGQDLIDAGSEDTVALANAIQEIRDAKNGLVTKDVQGKVDDLTQLLEKKEENLDGYTEASRNALTAAYAKAQALIDNGSRDADALAQAIREIEAALNNLRTPAQEARAEAVTKLDSQLSVSEGYLAKKDSYTAESLAALQSAIDKAKAVKNDATKDAAAVKAAEEALKTAIAGLVPKKTDQNPGNTETPVLAVGSTFTYKNAVYKVTESKAGSGTVSFVKPSKKTNKKFTIPAVVKKDGISFKVTAIEKNAFKANKKLTQVVIGKNVKNIGANAFSGDSRLKKITIKSTVLAKAGKNALKGVNAACKIKVPKSKRTSYTKILKKKGQKSTVKIV